MAAGAWTFTNATVTSILNGTFDFDTDSFKVALFDDGSNLGAGSTTFAGVTSEEGGTGYTAGGIAVTLSLSGTTTVTVDDSVTTIQWTAGAGGITCRYACLYEVAGNVVAFCELNAPSGTVTATDGNTLTITLHANGFFQGVAA